jgi:hypothetical protein
MNRLTGILFAFAAVAALADEAPGPSGLATKKDEVRPEATCAECGVIRSVKRIETKPRITASDREANQGLVANIPFDGSKPTIGSSTKLAREEKPPIISYEIVVRLDDGRFQIVMQEEAGDLHEGDKVKVDRGKVVLRGN